MQRPFWFVFLVLGIQAFACPAHSQCPDHAHVDRVEVSDDVRTTHCKCDDDYKNDGGRCVRPGSNVRRKLDAFALSSSSATARTVSLISDLEAAARTPHCVGSLACNFFVARVGELQNIPYFRDVMYPGKKPNDVGGIDSERVANKIYSFIEGAVNSPGSGWRRVTAEEAQELADRGNFVIGVARSRTGEGHGHIVVAAPQTMPKKPGAEVHHGPWVRDSQNPTESVRSWMEFGPSKVTPIWAVWAS
jgi:hypothetical protein